jgi:hypothetical protein
MRADPEPEESLTVTGRESAIIVCDSCGPEVRPDLFEAQRAMPRVVEPEYELLVGGAAINVRFDP